MLKLLIKRKGRDLKNKKIEGQTEYPLTRPLIYVKINYQGKESKTMTNWKPNQIQQAFLNELEKNPDGLTLRGSNIEGIKSPHLWVLIDKDIIRVFVPQHHAYRDELEPYLQKSLSIWHCGTESMKRYSPVYKLSKYVTEEEKEFFTNYIPSIK